MAWLHCLTRACCNTWNSDKVRERLMMLETLREYGLEALAANGEMETIRQAHAAYYLGLAEEAEPEWEGPQTSGVVGAIRART